MSFFFRIFAPKFMKTQTHKQWISGFLLALFVAFYFNTTFFSHVHIIDGTRIAHSHFHNKCHNNTCDHHYDTESEKPPLSGGHSSDELIFIATNSSFETLEATFLINASPIITMVCDDAKISLSENPEVGFDTFFFLRGPPTA